MADHADQPQGSPAAGPATGPIHEAILETLASAVISLESGVVTTFNAAAASLTGLAPETVIGRTFAEVFLGLEGAGDFAEAVLDAIYKGPLVRQRVVNASFPSGRKVLSVSVTRTMSDASDDGANSLAVTFDDISEVLELREKELVLAREVEARHKELREAYVALEERNRHLDEAQGKTRMARIGGTAAVAVLLVMLVLYAALGGPRSSEPKVPNPVPEAAAGAGRIIAVEAQPLTTVINVTGRLGPRREVEVTSPMSGKVAQVHVHYGAQVAAGQSLLGLDVTEMQIQHRDAEAAYIKARERLQETENWSESVDASRARRSVTKARIDLADSKRRLDETGFLLERGVIPAAEHEGAERDHRGRELDLEAAEQDLTVVLEKGVADGRVAQLELANAESRLRELEQTLELAVIKAPIAGVVMRPRTGGGAANSQQTGLVAGRTVATGEHLLTIGDVEGLSVLGQVDEVDVVQIQPGHRARVTGDAFPGVVLPAKVDRVSSEAVAGADGRSLPYFETVAMIEALSPERIATLRIGMSVAMEVIVREDSAALLVPLGAVQFVDGAAMVTLVEEGDARRVAVGTGVTTLNSVEITSGLSPGDRIRLLAP